MKLSSTARFILVGAFCAGLHNAVVIAADAVGVHYVGGNVLSYVVVCVAGYLLHTRFTYRETPGGATFLRYAAAMAWNYPLTVALMYLQVDVLSLPVTVASPTATVILIAWNYVASRWAIVTRGRSQPTTRPHDR